jgi:SOS-response transcriptional repressor LexA
MTPRERDLLDYVQAHRQQHGGVPPSYREIGRGIGIKSVGGVARILGQLEAKGFVRLTKGRKRSIEVLTVEPSERAFLRAAHEACRELKRHNGIEPMTRERLLAAWDSWLLAGAAP